MDFDAELLQKRAALIEKGISPYPYSFERTHEITEVREKQGELLGKEVRIAGRIVAYRGKGKMVFADLGGFRGDHLQIMFRKNDFDEAVWDVVRRTLDIGDWLGVRGPLFVTQMGELTVDFTRERVELELWSDAARRIVSSPPCQWELPTGR